MQVVTDDTEILEDTLTKIPNCQYEKEGTRLRYKKNFNFFKKFPIINDSYLKHCILELQRFFYVQSVCRFITTKIFKPNCKYLHDFWEKGALWFKSKNERWGCNNHSRSAAMITEQLVWLSIFHTCTCPSLPTKLKSKTLIRLIESF